jgi:hypothetical protein
MVILGHYIKIGPHRSKLPGAGRRILDCEGFFIAQHNPEFNGNTGSVPHSEVILV